MPVHVIEAGMCAVIALCPDCPPAREARGMFLHLDLLLNAAFAALPFAVMLLIAAMIVRAVSPKGSSDADGR
jgi:hypothetical protein